MLAFLCTKTGDAISIELIERKNAPVNPFEILISRGAFDGVINAVVLDPSVKTYHPDAQSAAQAIKKHLAFMDMFFPTYKLWSTN